LLALRLLHFRSALVAILMLPVGVLMGLPMMQKTSAHERSSRAYDSKTHSDGQGRHCPLIRSESVESFFAGAAPRS